MIVLNYQLLCLYIYIYIYNLCVLARRCIMFTNKISHKILSMLFNIVPILITLIQISCIINFNPFIFLYINYYHFK